MSGSLSDPPIVYTQQRFWLVVLFAIMAVGAYFFLPMSIDLLFAAIEKPPAKAGLFAGLALASIMLLALALMLAGSALFAVFRIISPGKLSMSPEGISYQLGTRVTKYDWRLVTNVRVERGSRGSNLVVFDYPDRDLAKGWFWRTNKRLGGFSVALGGYWNASDDEVANTIKAARVKWYGSE